MKDGSRMTDIIQIVGYGNIFTANNQDDIRSGSQLSKCCRDWSWLILMFPVSSKTVLNLQRGLLFIDAAVVYFVEGCRKGIVLNG